MRRGLTVMGAVVLLAWGLMSLAAAHEAMDLPAGPIHDRHDLMEGIGKNAKSINEALKKGEVGPIAPAAEKIRTSAGKITGLFPPGSTHPKSRAKPEIWSNWAKFEGDAKQLDTDAGSLVAAAKGGGDVKQAAETMFGACKSCHDDFRVPEKKKN